MVFTVPLTAYYFGVFSAVSPLTSLVCIPLASGNFMAGFLTVLAWALFGCPPPEFWDMSAGP